MTLLYVLFVCLQEDKDLVHEFVQNDGLACLGKVGSEADQNYQNYILRGEYRVPFLSNSSSVVISLTNVTATASSQSCHAKRCLNPCFVGPAEMYCVLICNAAAKVCVLF